MCEPFVKRDTTCKYKRRLFLCYYAHCAPSMKCNILEHTPSPPLVKNAICCHAAAAAVLAVRICFKVVADDLLREQLNTMDEERVVAFESDPCAMTERYAAVEFNGASYYRYY